MMESFLERERERKMSAKWSAKMFFSHHNAESGMKMPNQEHWCRLIDVGWKDDDDDDEIDGAQVEPSSSWNKNMELEFNDWLTCL